MEIRKCLMLKGFQNAAEFKQLNIVQKIVGKENVLNVKIGAVTKESVSEKQETK